MENEFKTGDRVKISKSSSYYGGDCEGNNPLNVEGTIANISTTSSRLNIRVTWDNGGCNGYSKSDLELVESKEVAKEKTSISEFKVGDSVEIVKEGSIEEWGGLGRVPVNIGEKFIIKGVTTWNIPSVKLNDRLGYSYPISIFKLCLPNSATSPKKITELKYPDVVHIQTEEDHKKLKSVHSKMTDWSNSYHYYLIGCEGFADNRRAYENSEYTIYEMNQIIMNTSIAKGETNLEKAKRLYPKQSILEYSQKESNLSSITDYFISKELPMDMTTFKEQKAYTL